MKIMTPALMVFLGLFALQTHQAIADSTVKKNGYFVKKVAGLSQADQAQSIQMLLESALQDQGQTVTSGESSALYVVETKAIPLGSGVVISVSKIENGKVRFSTQLKATQFEEVDRVTLRLARSLVEETSAQSNQEVGESVDEDGRQTTARTSSLNRWILGLGPMGMSHAPTTSGRAAFGFYLGYLFDVNPDWALRLSLETASKDEDSATTSMSFFSIGATRYLNRKNIAPFLRADFGYGSGSASSSASSTGWRSSSTESGFGLGVGAGYQFFRTSTVGLEVELKYQNIFSRIYDRSISMYGLGVKLLF